MYYRKYFIFWTRKFFLQIQLSYQSVTFTKRELNFIIPVFISSLSPSQNICLRKKKISVTKVRQFGSGLLSSPSWSLPSLKLRLQWTIKITNEVFSSITVYLIISKSDLSWSCLYFKIRQLVFDYRKVKFLL